MYLHILHLLLIIRMMMAEEQYDAAANQLVMYKNRTNCTGTWTLSTGTTVRYSETRTLNKNLFTNRLFVESLFHFAREKIPDRIVHTKGAGAFGYFEVTDDVTDICNAKFLNKIGKRTKIAVRFSLISSDKGAPDTTTDGRGFAIKFYTEEGNFDLVGLNFETFLIKDPIDFPSAERSLKRNPVTNFQDSTMMWDFITQRPEILNTILLVSVTTPDGYRRMPGFAVHTYQIVNKHGDKYFVRFHFIPDLGVKNLTSEEASKLALDDPDYNSRDLYNAIANSDFPSWTVSVQVATMSDVKKPNFEYFDVTKRMPKKDFPLRRIGRITLNQNPKNYFADVELLAFNPNNRVPGIDGGLDSVYKTRGAVYDVTQNHRISSNYNKVPVNCPLQKALTYLRYGYPPVNGNMGGAPIYYPNSFNGPIPREDRSDSEVMPIHEDQPNNLNQTRDLYLHGISESERKTIIDFFVNSLSSVPKFIVDKVLDLFDSIDHSLRTRVQKGLQDKNNKK